ncbi:MAG: esterase/lipase family protein [Rhodospirillales bacterium]
MPNQVAILHGWSDTSTSFKPLAKFLGAKGYKTVPLWLGDYISMDDDVKIEDVTHRMEAVVRDLLAAGKLSDPFDLIVHSTGGLVARHWIARYYVEQKRGCPVRRLIMLAPANFGSRLATTGKSMLGRVFKGAKNFFQTGTEMLNALELASPFQWDLSQRDLFVPDDVATARAAYGTRRGQVMPFVIVGSHPYPSGVRRLVNENGSDGTVRVSGANLNAHGLTVDFSANAGKPRITQWARRHGDLEFPFAALPDRDHGTVTTPGKRGIRVLPEFQARLGALILKALECPDGTRYRTMAAEWRKISEETASLAMDDDARASVFLGDRKVDPEYFHQYAQINVRVVDNQGAEVPDFFLEFFGPRTGWQRDALYFHEQVLEHVHPNSQGAATRCFFIDRTDLLHGFYDKIPASKEKLLRATVSVAPVGRNVSYFDSTQQRAGGTVTVHTLDERARWLKRNSTHFVKLIIPRVSVDKVFRLTRFQG